MKAVGAYIFSVSAASLLCGMICSLLQRSRILKPVKFITGMVLVLVVLRPVHSLNKIQSWEIPSFSFPQSAELVTDSVTASQKAVSEIIKQNTQAYILDKAAEMGLDIHAEVTLSDDTVPVPKAVTLWGTASPYAKLKLEQMLQEELNIAKENLIWTG